MNHTQKFITSRGGSKLAVYDWLYARRQKPRAAVLMLHNYGEYGLRQDRLAQKLVHWGFMVRSLDFYGHHQSEGKKGTISDTQQYENDAADALAEWRIQLPPDTPVLVWGWGMGALVALSAQINGVLQADAYCLTSPLLRMNMTAFERMMVTITRKLFPNLISTARIKPEEYTSNPETIMVMEHDALINRQISLRIVDSMFIMIHNVLSNASQWKKPSLLLYGGEKSGIDASGTQEFLMAADESMEVKHFPQMKTDLFNELDKEEVYKRLQQWLDKLYPATTSDFGKK